VFKNGVSFDFNRHGFIVVLFEILQVVKCQTTSSDK
jgi:hypothetical protein